MSALHDATTDLLLAERSYLSRLARRFTRCVADADDLVQETLLRAFRARGRFQPGTSIRAWTSTILRRVFLTDVSRTKRRRLLTDTDAGEPLDLALARTPKADFFPRPADLLERLDDSVKQALERVPIRYRTSFLLSVVEDLRHCEIAERTGAPVGTVMSRVHRAREQLKRELVHAPCTADRRRDRVFRRAGESRRSGGSPRPAHRVQARSVFAATSASTNGASSADRTAKRIPRPSA
jgi:RNA polymerase sigma-70 factor, ECF subfamily